MPLVADLLGALRKIHTDLIRHNRAASRPEQRRDLRVGAARKMAAIVSAERPVTVDLRLDCGVVLPHAVAREAETTATVLVKLTPNPFGSPAWQDYHHARFLERYGLRALVPVDELLNVESGLGFPAGYRDSRVTPPPRPGLSERDAALLALAQNAALQQNTEIVLDDKMIVDLAVGEATTARAQPHTELRFRVHAPTLDALDRGEFELAITGVSRAAGTTTGRFLDLFDTDDRERMLSAYAGLPTVSENALPVQLSCPAIHARTENVTRSPAVLPHLLTLAEHHTCSDNVIPLDDLAVSADAERLYLVSLSRRRPVEPAVFSAVEGDRRIRLDLDEAAHLHAVRAELDRCGHTTVREAPDPSVLGWIDGRAHDIVIPLAATARPVAQRAGSGRVISREHGLYAKLYGHPDRHTAILTTYLSNLLSTWDNAPQWWFIRYQDPEPHLRLRIRLSSTDAFGETARRVGTWAAELRRLGLIGQVQLDTYYPETGRFGGGAAMIAAESVFAADSTAAITQLTHIGRSGAPHQHAIIAASLVNLTTSFIGDIGDGMRWLIDHVSKTPIPAPAREVHDQAIRLADPHDRWAALRAVPGGEDIATAWARRRTVLATYRDTLTTSGQTAPEVVLSDLLHLHHVRMAGISPDTERACGRLARAAALSWTTRTQGAT